MESHFEQIRAMSVPIEELRSDNLVKLIRKLRWIGLEKEAHQLQDALSKFPAEERTILSPHQLETD